MELFFSCDVKIIKVCILLSGIRCRIWALNSFVRLFVFLDLKALKLHCQDPIFSLCYPHERITVGMHYQDGARRPGVWNRGTQFD